MHRSNAFFLTAGLFGRILADIVKHSFFERVFKVTLFQAMSFVYDVPELLDQAVIDFSINDCQTAVKPVSK